MKYKITNEILADIAIKEWCKYFNNTPAKQTERINALSISSVKQKKLTLKTKNNE